MGRAADASSTCGICVVASDKTSVSEAVEELKAGLKGADLGHLIVFFASDYDASELASALTQAFAGLPCSGCSTAGGIGPFGMMDGGILAVAFPRTGFRIHTGVIENITAFGVERASEVVRQLKSRLTPNADGRHGDRVFGVMLIDGLSNAEEPIVAAVHWAFDDMQLVGGSAGDGLTFHRARLIHDGQALENAAILILVETDYAFRIFKTENFEPTPIKLVVTAANAEARIVYELNAEPAAREYASAIGLMPDELGPFSFASYPLVVKVGGSYYCRSIRNMNQDGSLSFFCAIDEGLVFTVARPMDMLRATADTLDEIDRTLGGIDLVLGFDCILRRLDAETRQIRRSMEDLYKRYRLVGFHTYGEQLNSMHLNQTLTGVAFGKRRGRV